MIHNELICVGVSRKRLQRIALERNEALRAEFILLMRFPKTIVRLGDVMGGPKGGLELANLNHLCVDDAHLLLESFLLMDLWQVKRLRVH